MRKMLTFTKDNDRVRVLYSEGVCKTPDALAKVMNGGYAWESVKQTGDNTLPEKMKFIPKKQNPNDPRFLGIQNPPKAQPKPVEKNEDGTDKAVRTRHASNITPAILDSLKSLAEAGKTIMETSTELGISYANVSVAAKKHGITFVKGKKGKKKGVVKALDPALIEKMKGLTDGTIKQASIALDIPYPKLYILAKDNGIVFKAGQRGRTKKLA